MDSEQGFYSADNTTNNNLNQGAEIRELNYFGPKPRGLFRSYSAEDLNLVVMMMSSSSTSGNVGGNAGERNYSIYSEMSTGGPLGGLAGDATSLKDGDNQIGFDVAGGGSSTCSSSVAEAMSISGISSSGISMDQQQQQRKSGVHGDARPVLLGGSHKGWNAEVSAVLWRRMLGVLGDLNDIPDPGMHKLAFECLVKITDDFIKMKDNISYLASHNCIKSALDPSQQVPIQPSLHYFTAWLFRATTLPPEFKSGKLLAYKLLCIIALHRCEQCSSAPVAPEVQNRDFLILFYLAIKRALATYDMVSDCV